jgi:hypothetical protein
MHITEVVFYRVESSRESQSLRTATPTQDETPLERFRVAGVFLVASCKLVQYTSGNELRRIRIWHYQANRDN